MEFLDDLQENPVIVGYQTSVTYLKRRFGIEGILAAGAVAVSTSRRELW